MKNFLLLAVLGLLLTACSGTGQITEENSQLTDETATRRITERVVVVESNPEGTILSTGRYGDWYRVDGNLTERMYYDVTMEVPRQKSKSFIVNARLIDFTPGEFLQKDLMAKYDMAYAQIRTGTQ
ncbi:hypothetical protein [Christiangramia aquimixticola]|uniref:hypothetical protein n=1 Tax=Christiangramia aquimixticola TaxID=1697558 RepID=UPI003AA9946D